MADFKRFLYCKDHKVKCLECGKEMLIPNMMREDTRNKVLHPYCCAFTLFAVQWLLHHGWHVRDLGLHDTHPYFCPDCWEEGTPEYSKHDAGKQWCEQAEAWRKEQTEETK